MFSQIKTTKHNKAVVANLTRKFNLGAENVIARLAFCYSLSKQEKLAITSIGDSSGKEYSKNILFGTYLDFYIGMLCDFYDIHESHKDLPKYIKLHIDHGLELLNSEYEVNPKNRWV